MAVVRQPRGSSRGKAAASPNAEKYPKGVVQLIYAIMKDDKLTNNCIRIMVCLIIGCCVIVYTAVAAMKGVHGLTLPILLPGGMVGGSSLTYYIIRLIFWLKNRRGADATGDMPTAESPADASRTPTPP